MADHPNILFLLSDEHSYRFLSARDAANGGEPCRTPTLDGLVHSGVHFSKAYCQMPLCSPSRIAMLAGRHSYRCGAWSNGSILPPDVPTFSQTLGDHGYATCTVGKMHLGGSRQLAGFQHRPYGDFGGPCSHQADPLVGRDPDSIRSRTIDAGLSQVPEAYLQEQMVARTGQAWLREHRHRNPDQPWLLMASFSRPHFPLTAPSRHLDRYWPEGATEPAVGRSGDSADHPMTRGAITGFRTEEIEPEEGRKARASYFACVDFLDEMLGDFLTLLERDGALDNTVIIYASDHGEMAGEHGLWWKNVWHEASTRIPFIISTPTHRRGGLASRDVDIPVSLADLFPTLCGLAGIPLPSNLDGLDLSPLLCGKQLALADQRPGTISESLSPRWGTGTEFRMLRSDRYKYVAFRDCDDLAFDLDADPNEQTNLLLHADGDLRETLEQMRQDVLDGFDFGAVEELRSRQQIELRERFPARISPQTDNQIARGDGALVEADTPLRTAHVITDDLARDLDT